MDNLDAEPFFWRSADAYRQLGIDRFQLAYMSAYILHVRIANKDSFLWPSAYIIGLGNFLSENNLGFYSGVSLYPQYSETQELIERLLEEYKVMVTAKYEFANKELSDMLNVGRSTIDDWIKDGTLAPIIRREYFGPRPRNVRYFPYEQIWNILHWNRPLM